MKMTVVLLISVVHLLLAFSSSPCATAQHVVLDAEGNVVETGSKYYIVSAFYGAGGGGIRRADDSECPAKVIQSPFSVDRGTPVYFTRKASKKVEITESTDLNIEFYKDNQTHCSKNVWFVEGYPGLHYKMDISTDGVAGELLQLASWFQIKKANSFSYKLSFCPLSFGGLGCMDIGTEFGNDGQRRLAVRGQGTFNFILLKDIDDDIGIKSVV
ncbi:21 kDa seed protein [Capsicum galapagoense]